MRGASASWKEQQDAVLLEHDKEVAAGNDVKFYTSDTIAGSWTQLGSTVTTAGVTSVHAGTGDLEIGRISSVVPFVGSAAADFYREQRFRQHDDVQYCGEHCGKRSGRLQRFSVADCGDAAPGDSCRNIAYGAVSERRPNPTARRS